MSSSQIAAMVQAFRTLSACNQLVSRGVPPQISDNGPFVVGNGSLLSEPKPPTLSPEENGYCKAFNRKHQDERLNGEILLTQKGALMIEN